MRKIYGRYEDTIENFTPKDKFSLVEDSLKFQVNALGMVRGVRVRGFKWLMHNSDFFANRNVLSH